MLAYVKEHYGDIASVVGLVISILGFGVTIFGVRKAKQAAEGARQAAREAVLKIKSQILSNELEAAIRLVRGIEKHCREKKWGEAADLCDEARSRLSQIPQDDRLTESDRQAINISVDILGRHLIHVDQIRSAPENKTLSTGKLKELHQIITTLGQIYGRLQSIALEFKLGD